MRNLRPLESPSDGIFATHSSSPWTDFEKFFPFTKSRYGLPLLIMVRDCRNGQADSPIGFLTSKLEWKRQKQESQCYGEAPQSPQEPSDFFS